ncbi:unnamed protein product [Ectocarpus fasciculatus]
MSKSRVACVHNKMRAGCKVCLRERLVLGARAFKHLP